MGKFKVKNVGFLLLGAVFIACSCLWFSTRAAKNYSDVMRRANEQNPNFGESKVYDIGMLAAHDSLSDRIKSSSPYDYSSNIPEVLGLEKTKLVKSIAANYARAQSDSLGEQLEAGVRYVDARITCKGGTFYGTHSMISGRLETYLKELITFLINNPGEFVVFDINYYSTKERNATQLAEYMQTVKVNQGGKEYNIYDFINYDTSKDFAEVTYNDVTNNGSKGGLIILPTDLGEVKNSSLKAFFNKKIRVNKWYNEAYTDDLLSQVDSAVKKNKDKVGFRCNQLQTTPDGKKIARNLGGSLLSEAETHNIDVIRHSRFEYWLTCMPIVWFDNVTMTKSNFNTKINDKIMDYNVHLNNEETNLKYNKITSNSQLKDGMKIMIKEAIGADGYYGDNYKPGTVGTYVGKKHQFIMKDIKGMWQIKKCGSGWKIKRSDGTWLAHVLFDVLIAAGKEGGADVYNFEFIDSGNVKICCPKDKFYLYIKSNKNINISRKYSDEFEIYA